MRNETAWSQAEVRMRFGRFSARFLTFRKVRTDPVAIFTTKNTEKVQKHTEKKKSEKRSEKRRKNFLARISRKTRKYSKCF